MRRTRPMIQQCFYGMAVFCLAVTVIVVGKPVLAPLALGCIFAFVLTPIVRSLEANGLGRGLSVGLTVSVVVVFAVALTVAFVTQLSQLARELPHHSQQFNAKVSRLRQSVPWVPDRVWQRVDDITGAQSASADGGEAGGEGEGEATTAATYFDGLFMERYLIVEQEDDAPWLEMLPIVAWPVLEPLGAATLALVLAVFMTAKRDDLRNRLLAVLGRARLSQTTELLSDSSYRLSRYLLGLVAVNFGFAAAFAIGLFFIGVPYAALWGCVAFFFRFIPWLGTALSMLLPLGVSVATQPGWFPPMAVAGLYMLLEFTTGNFIEPWLFGRSVGMNVLAVFVAIIFWTWAWGLIGLLLATPLTLTLVTLGRHFPCFGWMSLLLGDTHPLPLQVAFYQRILAKDHVELSSMLATVQQQSGHAFAMQSLILQALAHADRELRRGAITKAQHDELSEEAGRFAERLIHHAERRATYDLNAIDDAYLEEVVEPQTHPDEEPTKVTAFSLGDDRGLQGIRVLFANQPRLDVAIRHQPMSISLARRCAGDQTEIVVLSVADRQGRSLLESACRMLRRCGYEGWIAAGWWRSSGIAGRHRRQLKEAGADYVTHRLYAMERMVNYAQQHHSRSRDSAETTAEDAQQDAISSS